MKICDEFLNLVLYLVLFFDFCGFFYYECILCVIIFVGFGVREVVKDIVLGEGVV